MSDKGWCHMTAPVHTLVVEDEPIVARDLERLLKGFGHKVVGSVRSGAQAIKKAIETGPDLILMDISLRGDIDGIEAARTIQARMETAIVFLTACAGSDVLERVKATGPYAYLIKPVSSQDLKIAVEKALTVRRQALRPVSLVAGLAGLFLLGAARPLAYGQFVFLTIAFGCLTYAFVVNDFSVLYVAQHSNLIIDAVAISAE